ncbi:hypothetical protein VFPFJ_10749 [Purpureocillium lilacinum]|uniref:Uncharacterized protein n=1 Tax=Purpureocillium lilacinum TaxID=33203 RepID=A0A179GF55_PURLI|nr:hypothetical protein VFPFJ_10749 [Purpureocillium lilacinum]OAQ75759.1 hypothetical protein VFPFJ_10749 [Purpureocillium lilacinum]
MRHHHHSPLTTHQPPRPLATSYVVTTTTSGHHKRPPRKKFPEYPSRACVHAVTLPVPIDFGPWHAGHVPDQMGILRRRHAPPVHSSVGRAVEVGEFRIRP